MRIVPVLDVMHGEVVRGVGGRRDEYRPLVSPLVASSRPLDVAKAIASRFGRREIYVADLDAILGSEPSWPMYAALRERGFRLWVDAGIQEVARANQLAEAGIESIVVGLETVAGPAELAEMARAFGERIVFSLDLRQGEPLGDPSAWRTEGVRCRANAEEIAAHAVARGVRRVLVLDLARVGLRDGTGTRELCRRLSGSHPDVEISAGGGIRHRGDLEELRNSGVKAVLIASALHDGRLCPDDLRVLREGTSL